MASPRTHAGFTLIELLLVIGILGLLAAALLAGLSDGTEAAHRGIDRIKLRRMYDQMLITRDTGAPLPPRGGAELAYYPWVAGTIERSPTNLELRFAAGSVNPRRQQLLAGDTRELFDSYDEITSADTDFAGRTAATYSRRMFRSGFEPLLSTDPDADPRPSTKVQVLFGDGSVRDVDRSAPELSQLRR